MTKRNCEDVRRELDEVMLGDECSSTAREHVGDCAACREFEQQQTKLRQIVGSLGVVQAPPDFDFRLRARLANESGSGAYHLKAAYWSFSRSAATALAALVLFVGGYFLVRYFTPSSNVEVARQTETPPGGPSAEASPSETTRTTSSSSDQVAKTPNESQKPGKRNQAPQRRRQVIAADFASERAPVISNNRAGLNDSGVFPIDASQQSFRFSLDDGRGNARTISLPRVTFGSQRVLATGNQLGPKGVW